MHGNQSRETYLHNLSPKMNVSSLLKYSIFIGLSALFNLYSIQDSGATVYNCQDRRGQTVFTDSPAQLKNCQVFSSSLSPSNGKEQVDQEQLPAVPAQNSELALSGMPSNRELGMNEEIESIPPPPALHANESSASSPFSILGSRELPPGLEDMLESGNMPPPEIFNEGILPQGLTFNNDVSSLMESQEDMTGKEIQHPGFFIPPDVQAPTLSDVPDSIFSNQLEGLGRK